MLLKRTLHACKRFFYQNIFCCWNFWKQKEQRVYKGFQWHFVFFIKTKFLELLWKRNRFALLSYSWNILFWIHKGSTNNSSMNWKYSCVFKSEFYVSMVFNIFSERFYFHNITVLWEIYSQWVILIIDYDLFIMEKGEWQNRRKLTDYEFDLYDSVCLRCEAFPKKSLRI